MIECKTFVVVGGILAADTESDVVQSEKRDRQRMNVMNEKYEYPN